MLGWGEREGVKFRKEEAFKDLSSRTEDRDWAVAGSLVGGFEERDDGGGLPDGGDVCSIV